MLKLLLLTVLVAVALGANHVCKLTKGKDLKTFSGTTEQVKFGCKFNAVKSTKCGNYKEVTVSPALKLAKKGKVYVYVVDSLFVGLTRNDGETLSVRMDQKTVGKFFNNTKDSPISWKEGTLNISHVFDVTDDGKKLVTLTEKRIGDFTVTYELYDGKTTQTTEMSFTCASDKFEPNEFPEEVCGNGTSKEVKTMKKAMGVKGNRRAIIIYSVFTNKFMTQMDPECKKVNKKMSGSKCANMQMEASTACWPITYKDGFIKCLYGDADNQVAPRKVFRSCVDFVCSNYTDTSSCNELKGFLSDRKCPNLKPVTDKLKSLCGSSSN